MISGAQLMVKCLESENVTTVFGYPGAAICPFYDSLFSSYIRHILVREEQNAAHAASGWSRSRREAGVCIATSGPGATNLITGIATAYMDSIPIIAITGQVSLEQLGRDVFQEADITGACESFTKHSYLIRDAGDIPRIFKEAFHIACSGRPGPVLIDVPYDVQTSEVSFFDYPERPDIPGYKPTTLGHPMQIKKALTAISQASRPIICCGGGVVSAGAHGEMAAFAMQSGIPVVSTMMGIGALPMDNPIYLGMIGNHGVSCANRAIGEADLIILCGARVGDRAIAVPHQIAEKAIVIHIDIDPVEIGKNMRVDIPIVGDIKSVLSSMTGQLKTSSNRHIWTDIAEGYKLSSVPSGRDRDDYVEPRSFIRKLADLMESDAILTADPGQSQIWAALHFTQRNGKFLTSGGLGTMGYAIPAAIGAKLANPDRQVVAICGDGAFQMSMCELATICHTNIDVKIIIMDNHRLGMVREFQDMEYGARHYATLMDGNPDFVRLCQAYGIPAKYAHNNAQARDFAHEMLGVSGPFVLVCKIDPQTPSL